MVTYRVYTVDIIVRDDAVGEQAEREAITDALHDALHDALPCEVQDISKVNEYVVNN